MKKLSYLFLMMVWMVSSAFGQAEMTPALLEQLNVAAQTNSTVRTLVMLNEQVDIEALDRDLTLRNASLSERAYTVITALRNKAMATQGSVISFLDAQASEDVVEFEAYWIVNCLVVEARASVLLDLGIHPDISYMSLEPIFELEKPVESSPAESIPGAAEAGLKAINAHKVWAEGFTGKNRRVMNIDTGVEGNHIALRTRWLGNRVPASEAWLGSQSFPHDCDDHGTHTMGTMTGYDPATFDTVGVAFDAEWMAAGALGCGTSVIASFQWSMDPDNDPATIKDMPDVINNSYASGSLSAQCPGGFTDQLFNSVEAGGIAIVFSAGNDGPGASTITVPKNLNSHLVSIWATGALDGNNSDHPIAGFSSRGPSSCGGTGSLLIKPEASAPGVSVRSTILNNNYGNKSGTSMAAPHVAGSVALLRQAFPYMSGRDLKLALYNTAEETVADLAGNDPGEPGGFNDGEDNNYGNGMINVYAAFQSLHNDDDPENAQGLTAQSDFQTTSSVQLAWTDPSTYVDGSPLISGSIDIYRDGIFVDSVALGTESYMDTALVDGQFYEYFIIARDDVDSLSTAVYASAYAGGAGEPMPATGFVVSRSTSDTLELSWNNPTRNIDGTLIDDFGGVRLYEDEQLVATFTRTAADTGIADGDQYFPPAGSHRYYIVAIDDEIPVNESEQSEIGYSFLLPEFVDQFVSAGAPNADVWISTTVDITDGGVNPPSPDFSLTLDAHPDGPETITSFPVDLRSYTDSMLVFSYWYQPEGDGNRPESSDSLILEFRNSLGQWISIRAYPGQAEFPFEHEVIHLDSVDAGSGATFYHLHFQFRYRCLSGPATTAPLRDVWFVDDVFLGNENNIPTGIDGPGVAAVPARFELHQNYPNPFNPSTTIRYDVTKKTRVVMKIYNMLGQEVRTLVNGVQPAGQLSVVWDGKNQAGQFVSSGIYVYRIEAGNFLKSRKMLFLK